MPVNRYISARERYRGNRERIIADIDSVTLIVAVDILCKHERKDCAKVVQPCTQASYNLLVKLISPVLFAFGCFSNILLYNKY